MNAALIGLLEGARGMLENDMSLTAGSGAVAGRPRERSRRRRLKFERLDGRQLLATIEVDLFVDEMDGDTTVGDISLREAIWLANSNREDDEIVLKPGRYVLSLLGSDEDKNETGDLDITDVEYSTSLRGAGADVTTIDAEGLFFRFQSQLYGDRVLHLHPGVTASISGLTIRGGRNTSYDQHGGGLLNEGELAITASNIADNIDYAYRDSNSGWVNARGGGIANTGILSLDRSAVTFNQIIGLLPHPLCLACPPSELVAGEGGGIWNTGELTVVNSTISTGTASSAGGVFNSSSGSVEFSSSTIAANTDFGVVSSEGGLVTAEDSIIAGNNVGMDKSAGDFEGVLTSLGYNLIGSTNGAAIVGNTQSNLTDIAAELGRLQANGGSTPTHALLPGSPAIDAAGETSAARMDQRGVARPQDGDGDGTPRSDIGAYEAEPASSSPPRVLSIEVNADQVDPPDLPTGPQPSSWARQRSDIRTLAVTFSEPVTMSASDVRLLNLGVDAPQDVDVEIPLGDDQIDLQDYRLMIQFASNPLPDGIYQIEILPTTVDLDGQRLDGNADGVSGDAFLFRGNAVEGFYQLAAEFNGDGGVSLFDFTTFAYWFGQPVPTAPHYVDMNRDGRVSIFDFARFVDTFGQNVVFPPPTLGPSIAGEAVDPLVGRDGRHRHASESDPSRAEDVVAQAERNEMNLVLWQQAIQGRRPRAK